MDISNLCRGCMKEAASWERGNFDTRAVEMFSFCTNIRITEEDRLPKQFCYDCIIKMESSYTFITEAQKVNVTLKNIISRTSTVIVEPDTSLKTSNLILDHSIKLTLPDYKICSVIENDTRQFLDPIQNIPEQSDHHESLDDNLELRCETEILDIVKVIEPVREMEDIEVKSNVCLVCKKKFISKTWYEKHMQKEHSGKKYVCTQCPKSFSRPSQLSAHAVSHSDERRFPCAACGKRFKRRKQLAAHARAHGDARPYACDHCTARFKTKSILKSHMAVHKKDKPFLCSFCGWSFIQAGNLKVHLRLHTGEKPYSCAVCGFRCAAASSLRRHQRAHAAARSHVCPTCGKAFYDASNLARHARTHTGALPYQCPRCASAFSDSWKRKTHLMRAHRLALPDIPRMRTDGRLLQPSNNYELNMETKINTSMW